MDPSLPDPYKILGVSKDAKLAEIKSCHRKLVLKCHPDKVHDATLKAMKHDEFQRVQQAYELLSDDSRRQLYDDQVKLFELRKEMGKGATNDSRRPFDYEVRTAEPRPDRYSQTSSQTRKARDKERRRESRRAYVEDLSSEDEYGPYRASGTEYSVRETNRGKEEEGYNKKQGVRKDRGKEHAAAYIRRARRAEQEGYFHSVQAGSSVHSPFPIRPSYESPRRGSFSTSEKPKLQRTNSSSSMDYSMRKMHYSMGSDYGGSDNEGFYRSRPKKKSRATSRQRSYSRNRAHSDAYAPPERTDFINVRYIVSDGKTKPLSPPSRLHRSDSSPSLSRVALKECFCCSQDFRPNKILSLPCEHLWCSSCLSRLVQLALDYKELWPPKCCSTEIPRTILLKNLDQSTNAKYQAILDGQSCPRLKCPDCLETFSDLRLILRHREKSHLESQPSPSGTKKAPEKVASTEEASSFKDTESDTCRNSTSSRASEESSPSTTITEPDPDPDPNKETSRSSTPPSLALNANLASQKAQQQWKFHQLPRIVTIFLAKESTHFLGLQTTAWFILVLAAVATAITTTYSIQGLPPDPPPQIGDSNYYSLLSQSIIAVCSLYYLMVPYLRGDEDLPVRALFYICWTLSLAGAITAPLIYTREWTKSVWAGFCGTLAQVAATAFLFEHVGRHERKRSKGKMSKVGNVEESEEDEGVEKYTDTVE